MLIGKKTVIKQKSLIYKYIMKVKNVKIVFRKILCSSIDLMQDRTITVLNRKAGLY